MRAFPAAYLLTSYVLLITSIRCGPFLLLTYLLLTSYFLLLTSYVLRLTSYLLPLTSYLLLITSYFSQVPSFDAWLSECAPINTNQHQLTPINTN